jgi:cold shock CspA family protein
MDALEITFRGIDKSPAIESLIVRRVDRLQKFCGNITNCRVAVERPHRHEQSGNPYRVRIECKVPPGHDLVVVKNPGDHTLQDSLQRVVKDAFDAAERQAKSLSELRRGDVKSHDEAHAVVIRKYDDAGFGFLLTPDGREIYFHENSVAHHDFARLAIGTEVRFAESTGEKGPQASTVQIVNKPGERIRSTGSVPGLPRR